MKTKTPIKDFIARHSWYWKNSDLTDEHFPLPAKVETEGAQLIDIPSHFSNGEEALSFLKKRGLRPANVHELMAWFDTNKDSIEGSGKWYAAFGQTWEDADGSHRVPYVLADSDGDFEFDLGHFGLDWDDDHCLLCFCDESLAPSALSAKELGLLESLTARVEALEAWKNQDLSY